MNNRLKNDKSKSTRSSRRAKSYGVSGRVYSAQRAGVGGLGVELVDKSVAVPDVVLASSVTDIDGNYQMNYSLAKVQIRRKAVPDIQLRIYSGDFLVGVSEVRYQAQSQETLDIILKDTAAPFLPSEHETLTQ